jgi:hypothetical protein
MFCFFSPPHQSLHSKSCRIFVCNERRLQTQWKAAKRVETKIVKIKTTRWTPEPKPNSHTMVLHPKALSLSLSLSLLKVSPPQEERVP